MMNYRIEIQGLEEFKKALQNAPTNITRHLRKAMDKSVTILVSDIKPEWPIGATGGARQSIGSEVKSVGSAIEGKVGSSIKTPYPYPLVTELGRRPGKAPPPGALDLWVRRVLRVPPDKVRGVAFLIGRKIARRGIKGKFIFKKALESNTAKIQGYFNQAIERIARDLSK
jgi:hypothetical protein